MKEFHQLRSFYAGLTESERADLAETIATDIYFLDEELQQEIIKFLNDIEENLGFRVREINGFTL
jgi:catalase